MAWRPQEFLHPRAFCERSKIGGVILKPKIGWLPLGSVLIGNSQPNIDLNPYTPTATPIATHARAKMPPRKKQSNAYRWPCRTVYFNEYLVFDYKYARCDFGRVRGIFSGPQNYFLIPTHIRCRDRSVCARPVHAPAVEGEGHEGVGCRVRHHLDAVVCRISREGDHQLLDLVLPGCRHCQKLGNHAGGGRQSYSLRRVTCYHTIGMHLLNCTRYLV